MENVQIRLAQQNDLKLLAKLFCKVYSHFDVGEKWTPVTASKLLAYWFSRQPDLSFVAQIDGKVVGAFLAGIKPWWDGNHLVDGELFVDPDFQKRGIGTLLSRMMYETAIKKYNAVCFDTITFAKKPHPLEWYKELGFTKVEEWVLISGNLREVVAKLKQK